MKYFFLVVIFFTNSALALADWVFLGQHPAFNLYADKSSLAKSGSLVTMSYLYDYKKLQTTLEGKPFHSGVYVAEFDCGVSRTRLKSFIWYSKGMGKGNPVYLSRGVKGEGVFSPWITASSENLNGVLLESACDKSANFHQPPLVSDSKANVSLSGAELPEKIKEGIVKCALGDAKTCFEIGQAIEVVINTEQAKSQAVNFYKKACEGGNADGCYMLANSLFEGVGVPINKPEAMQLYAKACDIGKADACADLGSIYAKGLGIDRDSFKGIELLLRACNGGSSLGCLNAGIMVNGGMGVRLDKKRALELFGKACDLKDEDGCKNYAILKNSGV
jgi:hypothetical protein